MAMSGWALQEMKHLAEPSPSVKLRNKRPRDGHKEDEKPPKSIKSSDKKERASTAKDETRTSELLFVLCLACLLHVVAAWI